MHALTRDEWTRRSIAERISFSSFSRAIDDRWGRDIPRPYGLYVKPEMWDAQSAQAGFLDKDALRLKERIEDPVIIWDGFSPIALHEIALECLPKPLKKGVPFHIVFDERNGRTKPDARSKDFLALRPEKKGPMDSQEKAALRGFDLAVWSSVASGNKEAGWEDRKTFEIYVNMLSRNSSALHGNDCKMDCSAHRNAFSQGLCVERQDFALDEFAQNPAFEDRSVERPVFEHRKGERIWPHENFPMDEFLLALCQNPASEEEVRKWIQDGGGDYGCLAKGFFMDRIGGKRKFAPSRMDMAKAAARNAMQALFVGRLN